ncbi:MFS transporter [Mycoplasmatota bacterium WC30]
MAKVNMFSQYKGLSKSAYVLFIARMVTNMGAFIWPMLTLILSVKLGYSKSEIAYLFLIISLIFLPATIIAGKIADKFNKKKIIIVFDIISVCFFIAAALVEPGTPMLIFFITAGLFATMEGPAHEAIVIESTLPKERERVYSLNYLGHNIGFIVGAALGGFLITNYLSLAFVIDGITTLMSTLLIVLYVKAINIKEIKAEDKNVYEDSAGKKDTGFNIMKNRKPILLQIIIIMITAFIYDQWAFILPLQMADIFGEVNGPLFFGFVASFNGFVVIIATPIITYLLRKFYEIPKIIVGTLLYSVCFFLLIGAEQLPIFFIFIFIFTLGEIINTIGMGPYFSRRIPSSHRGRINSYRNISAFTGTIVGKLMIGILIDDYGFKTAYATIVGFGVIAVILTLLNYIIDKKTFPKLYTEDINKSDFQ